MPSNSSTPNSNENRVPPPEGGAASWQLVSKELSILESRLGYSFRSRDLLLEALTHPSYAYEHQEVMADNQRLEFLGDAVLQLVVSEYLYHTRTDAPEGLLTKLRSRLVCEPTLTELARALGLGDHLRLGHGESLSGGADNPSNLSDALEAVFGAIYLEAGLDRSGSMIRRLLTPYAEQALRGELTYDHKSRLYEWAQADGKREVTFTVLETEGPEHDRVYKVGLLLNGQLKATGSGRTKKAAEQEASLHFFQDLEN